MANGPADAPDGRDLDLTPEERELVKRLRAEAGEVKDCATKYGFQALVLSTVVMGAIVPLLNKFPPAGFAAVPLVVFLLAIVRITLHKFETANRLYGYELHIYQRARLEDSTDGWNSHMRRIGWEEAFYAWRVVQPSIYREVYNANRRCLPVTMKRKYAKENKPYWFRPTLLHGKNEGTENKDDKIAATDSEHARNETANDKVARKRAEPKLPAYFAGDYLHILHFVLHVFALGAWLILVYMCWQLALEQINPATCKPPDLAACEPQDAVLLWGISLEVPFLSVGILATIATLAIIVVRVFRMQARRRILQDELLSISCCATVWLAVVVAHFRALIGIGAEPPDYRVRSIKNYTLKLVEQAEQVGKHVDPIYDWVDEGVNAKTGQPDPQ